VGWALGVERVLELVREQGNGPELLVPDAYAVIADQVFLPFAIKTLQALRATGVSIQMHSATGEGMGSMKSQFKKADASGARFALVFGAEEIASAEVTVKSLRDGNGAQSKHPVANVCTWAQTLQSNA